MEAQIRYAKTTDGVNIAYTVIGEGSPCVWLTPFIHSFEDELGGPEAFIQVAADWLKSLGRSLVRYDGRGTGLSQRDVNDISLEARYRDLAAVVQALGLPKFDLVGWVWGGPVATAYAARHPESVDRLVLYGTFARAAEIAPKKRFQSLIDLARSNWALASQVFADFSDRDRATDSISTEIAGLAASSFRKAATGEFVAQFLEQAFEIDVSDSLSAVKAPTLVLHRVSDRVVPFILAQKLAANIPNARLVPLQTSSFTNTWDPAAMDAMSGFLGGQAREPVPVQHTTAASIESAGTAIILFADIADSTALTERLGDAAFRAKARELDGALRGVIREHAGTTIEGKLLGDGVLAVFTSARQAIEAALACGDAGASAGLPLHLGLHAGDVMHEKDPDGRANVYGGAVNIASRISGLSAPGEVLVSETVRSLARTSAGVRFEDRGEQALKGVGEAVRVWAVAQ
jgi:pimeloyl-ACP methyl ester carboxylesterase/class 3 adenylate cyclase